MTMPRKESTLKMEDWVVIGVVMLISAGIGVYYRFSGGKQKTAEEFFSANRSMSIVPLGIALMVSFVSAVTILGISAEIYAYGTQFMVHYCGVFLGTFVVAFFYLPVFWELNCMSVYEYLERRFGVGARLATSMANFAQLTLYSGVVLYAPSLAIEATVGLSSSTSILLVAIICMFYSTIGGIKAVLVTDILQALLMFGSIICIMAVASGEIEGGLLNVWSQARETGHATLFDFRIDPTLRYNFWSLILMGFCLCCSLYGVNQVEVQRLMTVKSLKSARLALFLNLPLLIGFGWLTSFCGLTLYVLYKNCNPMASGQIDHFDRIMPFFAATKMAVYPGLTGLFIAGIFSASLSTISAMLNSLSAVFLEDYVKRLYIKMGKTFPTDKAIVFGKFLSVAMSFVTTSVAFACGSVGSLIRLTLTIMGAISGPVLGIFTLGMFFENTNEKGAITGMVTALLTCLWAGSGQPRPHFRALPITADGCNATGEHILTTEPPIIDESELGNEDYFYLYRISYFWYSSMGLTITLTVGYLASLLFSVMSKEKTVEPDPSLFTPLVAARIRRRRAKAAAHKGPNAMAAGMFTMDEAVNVYRKRDPSQ